MSSSYYRSDTKDEVRNQVHVDYSAPLTDASSLNAGISYRLKDGTTRRTFTNPAAIFDPSTFSVIGLYDTTLYGDTKDRDAKTHQVGMSLQYSLSADLGGTKYRFIAGASESYGRLSGTYYDVQTGFAEDYRLATFERDSIIAEGLHRRWSHALYVNNEFVIDRLSVFAGARYDNIDDTCSRMAR
jgi:hypothetical protein